jgi:DME family drug/metabolite transporter
VLVDHDMNLVLNLCDHIEVLDFGRIIASGTPTEMRGSSAVADAYRATIAVSVLVLLALLRGRLGSSWALARREWRRVMLVGLLTATFQTLYFLAVVAIGVSVATVVCLGFAPVLLLILDAVRRRRRPARGQTVTVTVAVTGLLLVSLADGLSGQTPHRCSAYSPPGLGRRVRAVRRCCPAAGPTPGRPDRDHRDDVGRRRRPRADRRGARRSAIGTRTTDDIITWAVIGYLGVVTMAVAYALMFTGLRSTPPGAAMVATLIEPVTAVALAVVFLDERLTLAALVGCLLILGAIASLGHRPRNPSRSRSW